MEGVGFGLESSAGRVMVVASETSGTSKLMTNAVVEVLVANAAKYSVDSHSVFHLKNCAPNRRPFQSLYLNPYTIVNVLLLKNVQEVGLNFELVQITKSESLTNPAIGLDF